MVPIDPNANRANIKGIELYGAEVIVVENRNSAGGYLGSRLKTIDRILQSDPNAIWLNQYANIANKKVHAKQQSRANSTKSIGFLWEPERPAPSPESGTFHREFPRIKVVAVDQWVLSRSAAHPGNETFLALARA